ncbi:hypothetical protein TWF730_004766 [Orbilia blumenaviensis]|uniref:Uncharacterized protein n=1 Tax=Orbilia blumenaviensis TaxID=1796055 RepID=A0AAV9TX70_9PEZI
MVLECRSMGTRKPSGSRLSHGFFTPEEKHSKTDYIGAFADGLIGRRDRRVTKDDMCIDLNRSPAFTAARMIIEDDIDGSICSRSSSRTGDSERTSHTSFEVQDHLHGQQQQQQRRQQQQNTGEPYSPAIAVHYGSTGPYPTPQPASKPQTPVQNLKMQRFSSLPGVDLSNLPPTPDSLRGTPLSGLGLDGNRRRRQPSPEIPSADDLGFGKEITPTREVEADEEVEQQQQEAEWEDIEEDGDEETIEEDNIVYESMSEVYESEIEQNGLVSSEEEDEEEEKGEDQAGYAYENEDYEDDGGGEEEEGGTLLHFRRALSLSDDIDTADDNEGEGLDEEDGPYTPKLRAKLEASPQLSPVLEAATTFLPPPSITTSSLPITITTSPDLPLPSTEPIPLVNRTFKLTSHTFSRPIYSSSAPRLSLSRPSSSSRFSASLVTSQPRSSSEGLPPPAALPSGLSTSDLSLDTLVSPSSQSPPHPSVVHLLSDFIGVPPASPSPSVLSAHHPADSTSINPSGLSINYSSKSSVEPLSGPSSRFSSRSPLDSSLSHSIDSSPSLSPSKPLDTMTPFIRTVKADQGILLESSIERRYPKKQVPGRAGSCIPVNPSEFREYAQECIWAADAGRLNPWNLHEGEYGLLREHLNQLHVTTYLNIRNGILRLWLKNSKKRVTKEQAMGCCKEERYFGLAEVALGWLTRSGYINHGCLEIPTNLSAGPGTRRRKIIAVIGAGISGLATARQLEALLASAGERSGGPGVPDVVVFEGRHRLGGRVYSAILTPGPHSLPEGLEPAVDIGGQIVMGYDARNPLAALIVDQLGIPFHTIGKAFPIHDHDGKVIGDGRDTQIEHVHNDILRRISKFSYKEPPPQTAHGDVKYITKCKDPWGIGGPPLSEAQGEGHVAPPVPLMEKEREKKEIRAFRKTLEGHNVKVAKGYHRGQASLGKTMEGVFSGYASLLKTDARDLRLFNWFQANLEYGNAVEVNGSSLEHWDQDDGNEPAGAHTMIMGGYSEVAKGLSSTPSELKVRLDHVVKRITYDPKNKRGKGVTLEFADGTSFKADKVVVTLPLGVLKREGVEFDPPLPRAKRDAIKRLGFGLLNKVIMVYEKAFWDTDNSGFGCLRAAEEGQDEDSLSSYEKNRGRFYIWWNTTDAVGRPTLVGLMVGNAAEQVEHEDPEEVMKEATSILKKCWGEDKVPNRPEECFVTKWRKDPFAFGSYSYVAPGSTGADYDTIAEPINDQIFFAGEHTSRKYPATVHGAYISGLRVAGEVADSILGPIQVPSPLVGQRIMKSRTETTVETMATRTTSASNVQTTKSTRVQRTQTTKVQEVKTGSRISVTSTIVQQKTKRRAAYEEESRVQAKRARTQGSQAAEPQRKKKKKRKAVDGEDGVQAKRHRTQSVQAEPSKQKRKRKAADEPELKVQSTKKARPSSTEAKPEEDVAPIDPKPEGPKKDTANPFLIYQKDFFKIAQSRANQTKREQTGEPDAKAERNEVRIVLGDMWRNAAADTKRRYQNQADQNKRDNILRVNDYKRQIIAWEERQSQGSVVASSSPALALSAVYPTPASTTPAVDDRAAPV